MTEKKLKTPPAYKPLNNEEINTYIDTIVDELHLQADSRDSVNEAVDYLNKTYGLKKPAIRAAARIVFKRNKEEAVEANQEILNIVELCK